MNLKIRLKAALNSFLNPSAKTPKVIIQEKSPEPSLVFNNQLLAGKNVLITGAGQNIGKSIALEMAKQGANIYFTDIVEEKCLKLEQELAKYQIICKWFISDISKTEDIDNLHNYFIENKIKLDILINNVGIQFNKFGIKNFELEEANKVFQTNIFKPMYLTKLIAEMMIRNQIFGSIIFITSIHQCTVFRELSYSTSKASLGMIIKELAIDLAAHRIRVNGIAPGVVQEDNKGNPLYYKYTPLHQSSINPKYIGRAVVYLASDYFSHFTTGTVMKIDAGLSLRNYMVEIHFPQ
ncbi:MULTISPECIES: SDR family NAD(P)-dependent oxidoreductase [unclassified Okeania]|uniref:SDR family NAD(P)-dependent oxidoreductase n=1 Tax=unclassified Okeania TaxID=2634635 RepID=UPI0013BCA34C|nr:MULTISPECIES: SDR family oxidoreductase [unclassified Okeania]NEP39328.1 SDR family oxidoreductase [Okeania sp. SIO2H7]NET11815.1 SDR family oxidoreductase [Okeania sp. SIO1H6]NEP72055.1 SDR family oxidoreductase [Okeania sp. SIO2G5]NEP92911.1 SDR family oxidoreductase [Okeania sp. SIO2F5]NEQ94108.1 SDR family oxidoreductase [Okeania sp. SIO2G4]